MKVNILSTLEHNHSEWHYCHWLLNDHLSSWLCHKYLLNHYASSWSSSICHRCGIRHWCLQHCCRRSSSISHWWRRISHWGRCISYRLLHDHLLHGWLLDLDHLCWNDHRRLLRVSLKKPASLYE